MHVHARRAVLLAALLLLTPRPLFASRILLISGGDASNDAAIQSVLQSPGDTVTIGPRFGTFTGSDLPGYNAVLLMPNGNWWPQPDMPAAGQQALVTFVNHGGGLVTGEPVLTMIESAAIHQGGEFKTLAQALPAWDGSANTANSPITFTTLTSDAVMNAGLPSTFSFPAKGYDTETYIHPRVGAISFFSTNQWPLVPVATFTGPWGGSGAAGWNYGAGRVLSLSTFSDNGALGDPNYDRMLTNAVDWVTQTSGNPPQPFLPIAGNPVPEPAGLVVFVAAGLGFLMMSRTRRKPPTE